MEGMQNKAGHKNSERPLENRFLLLNKINDKSAGRQKNQKESQRKQ